MMTLTSLSINPTLSPPPFCRATTSSPASASCSRSSFSAPVCVKFLHFRSSKAKPISLFVRGARQRTKLVVKASDNMTITEVRPEEEEEGPPLLDTENNSSPRRIALFVEPSPFAWVHFAFAEINYFLVSFIFSLCKNPFPLWFCFFLCSDC